MTDTQASTKSELEPNKNNHNLAAGVDAETLSANQRQFVVGFKHWFFAAACLLYTTFHIGVMNFYPLETWVFRLVHVSGGLALGFIYFAAKSLPTSETASKPHADNRNMIAAIMMYIAAAALALSFGQITWAIVTKNLIITGAPAQKMIYTFGIPLTASVILGILASWIAPPKNRNKLSGIDILLAVAALVVGAYIIAHAEFLRMRAQVFPHLNDMFAALSGILLILELTRRLAGIALVLIVLVFISYGFAGPYLPGVLNHTGYSAQRFFAFIYTDNGILGPTTAISSTYIILFIAFAAFLQASRVGEYFVNFAFAAAGGARGGPAKVAVFSSALMGMINGTSAGNVVSTGSLTIPLMKKVGYRPQAAASIEAAASSGGQILPPIMGAGAFIMSEITGITYTEIVIAAIIPAVLYFSSVYFMVDKEALKNGMKGLPREELPRFSNLAKQAFLFIPIIILIATLFMGYSVIRGGSLAMVSAVMVSWLTPNRMGLRAVAYALELAARMSLQMVAVCAAAGIIVGVIALTGVGTRFSSLLLTLAGQSQLIALFFAMFVSVILGMGMPTTAAYAVAASVIAPGLVNLGIAPLTAHFFIFYYAVMSAITPPVALAAYAGAAIAQSDPMKTSIESFKIGLAAFVVPFMFFYSSAMLMQGTWLQNLHGFATALFGIFLLASAIQGWFFGIASIAPRILLLGAALAMISGGWVSDIVGLIVAALVFAWQKKFLRGSQLVKGSD